MIEYRGNEDLQRLLEKLGGGVARSFTGALSFDGGQPMECGCPHPYSSDCAVRAPRPSKFPVNREMHRSSQARQVMTSSVEPCTPDPFT